MNPEVIATIGFIASIKLCTGHRINTSGFSYITTFPVSIVGGLL